MGATTRQRNQPRSGNSFGAEFHARRGTGEQPFPLRLARARLLHLRRREASANWLALTISIACYVLLAASSAHARPIDAARAQIIDAHRVSSATHEFVAASRRVAREQSRESTVESIANEVMS